MSGQPPSGILDGVLAFVLEKRLITLLALSLLIGFGIFVMPFDKTGTPFEDLPSRPLAVDAIPDIGEKQQIVFTKWPGRAPADVEDQVTTPLVARLLGVPGVKTVRASSMFGFSSVYVIFDDGADFYDARSRVLEKLSSMGGDLPDGVSPELGPDASALGQVYWYTLEGEGFSLEERRFFQDWTLRYALLSVDGVSEVASVGGLVRELQVDVDPVAMKVHDVRLREVERAVVGSNLDVGARELVLNGVEYLVRGRGLANGPADVENAVVRVGDGAPLTLRDVASVSYGPAPRRGALDRAGVETVGGVVTVRYGENPRAVIQRVKEKVDAFASSLPSKTLDDGRTSKMRIVPFYDRSTLIDETVSTLGQALIQQMLLTILVILLLLLEIRSAFLVAATLPIGVLLALGLMSVFGVESNIMSLGGIIIAIGTMVDMGIVLVESMLREVEILQPGDDPREKIRTAAKETGSAVLTAVATTVVSFLPVFAMTGPEAKLFVPLAFTKTFALVASVATALLLLPTLASFVFQTSRPVDDTVTFRRALARLLGATALAVVVGTQSLHLGAAVAIFAVRALAQVIILKKVESSNRHRLLSRADPVTLISLAVVTVVALTDAWMPLGFGASHTANLVFVVVVCGGWMGILWGFSRAYPRLLHHALHAPKRFLVLPGALVVMGLTVWLSFSTMFGFIPNALDKVGLGERVRTSRGFVFLDRAFLGLGREFMPPLDEGMFLFMPSVMPHAGIGEALDVLQKQDIAISTIPEVSNVVGKIGRADTALDPAPLSMIETIIEVKPEFRVDPSTGKRERQWRSHIKSTDDIWNEIVTQGTILGATGAPKLMPIAARIVMLQSGMRAPFGVKVSAGNRDDLETIALAVEHTLKSVPGVLPASVVSERVTGVPYIEIDVDRERAKRLGVRVEDAQAVIATALGGRTVSTLIEGRTRTAVRIRYARENRDSLETLTRALIPVELNRQRETAVDDPLRTAPRTAQVPLSQLADITITPGPRVIKSEDGFLVAYVTFDKKKDVDEVAIATRVRAVLDDATGRGDISLAGGASIVLAGTFENQVRSTRTLALMLPVALVLILILLLSQLSNLSNALVVFSSVAVAGAGGFVFLWIYSALVGVEFSVLGVDVIGVFRPADVKLSVAVWVGFIALFGIASDDGVLMSTFIRQELRRASPTTARDVRQAVATAAERRLRPCLMTTATTVLALLPVLTSNGRGSDVMTPMALPSVGGMIFEMLTLFVVPVLASMLAIRELPSNGAGIGDDEDDKDDEGDEGTLERVS